MDRPVPRLFKGMRDITASDLLLKREMIEQIRTVYERYGFSPLETPAIEYTDALGKFMPDEGLPEGGVFSLRNPDYDGPAGNPNEWLSLRYDLTAPLARVVAQYVELPAPFKRYQLGTVWRNEKPGPGRFREFTQFDFDTVGTQSMAADAEVCTVVCDALEAIGIKVGEYQVIVNDRKVLQGVLECCGLAALDITDPASQAGIALRAIDKLDRIGIAGVVQLLGKGRRDESGDFAEGAKLSEEQIALVKAFLEAGRPTRKETCDELERVVKGSGVGIAGIAELREIDMLLTAQGCMEDKVIFDPTVVRGLSYYTGPVFEARLTFQTEDENGQLKQFGSVFGGGRYDSLVERFTGRKVPATGASIGIDRLLEAIKLRKPFAPASTAEVLVTVFDRERMPDYMALAATLRTNGINTEVFLGSGGIGKQLRYADKLGIPLVVIAGSDEFARGTFQVKDLALGRELSESVSDRQEWREERPAQFELPAAELLEALKRTLAAIARRRGGK